MGWSLHLTKRRTTGKAKLPQEQRFSRRLKQSLIWGLLLSVTGGMLGCGQPNPDIPSRKVTLYQEWALQPGDQLGGYRVQSGLGDVAIDLQGNRIFMPFDGQVQPAEGNGHLCVILSSPDVPAYLFRLCGVKQPRLGDRNQGDWIGHGDMVAFATMRRQAMVPGPW